MGEAARLYDEEVQPQSSQVIDERTGRKKVVWINTRASKEARYEHFTQHKAVAIDEKERWAIDLLKVSLERSEKPFVACSFGIDSIVTIHLVRRALEEMGRDPSDIDIAWVDTLNEFLTVRKFAMEMRDKWNLRLIVAKPERTLKQVIDGNGGVTSDYFFVGKGTRSNGHKPLGEKCCDTLKHKPMKRVIKENAWDLQIGGIRADESKTRLKAGLRDGEYFYSRKEWRMYMCRPILWWLEEDVWNYVEKYDIPFNELYLNNLLQSYPKNFEQVINDNESTIVAAGIDVDALRRHQIQTVTRRQAILLQKLRFKLFTPRTGCQMCPIPVKYGYLQWMRIYYPKVYDAMVHKLGYGPVLISMVPQDVRDELREVFGIDVTAENVHEHLKEILAHKPCVFDRF